MKSTAKEVWKRKLADSTGQWAFVLTLSRRMIWMLQIVRDCDYNGIVNATVSQQTLRCLESRGLVEFHMKEGTLYRGKWDLTPAGECVIKVLEYAGVMLDVKLSKMSG